MPEENVEIVRKAFDYWERGEWARGEELYEDDCEVVFGTSWFPDADTYPVGREALAAWVAFVDTFDKFALGADRLIDVGEQVVALVWLRGRGQASGADVEAEVGAVFTLREGRITRWEMTDRQQALEAAGLSGSP